MFEVGLYYIASHETTYCTPTPVFIDTVKCIAHGHIIRRIRYSSTSEVPESLSLLVYWFPHRMRYMFSLVVHTMLYQAYNRMGDFTSALEDCNTAIRVSTPCV